MTLKPQNGVTSSRLQPGIRRPDAKGEPDRGRCEILSASADKIAKLL
jgi:hypothetical protein